MQQLTTIAESIITFINQVAVPFLFAIAFIVFLFGVFRYFILGGASDEKRKEGRTMIIYSVVGFAVMIVVWGLVNLIVGTLGITNNAMPALPTFNTTNTNNTTNTSGGAGTPTNILPTGMYNNGTPSTDSSIPKDTPNSNLPGIY